MGLKRTLTDLLAASAGRATASRAGPRVLTFHDINGAGDDLFALAPSQLERFLILLKEKGYHTVGASDLVGGRPAVAQDESAILLTFDDGYASHRDTVAELLLRHGMTATFFLVSSLLGDERLHAALSGRPHDFMCARDAQEMQASGFEIGSHSHNHVLCGALPLEQIRHELLLSKQVLEERLHQPVTSFAYPFGRRGAYSQLTRHVLLDCGYSVAFTQEGLPIRPETDLLQVPRTSIDRLDTDRTFTRKLHGQYELLARIRCCATRS